MLVSVEGIRLPSALAERLHKGMLKPVTPAELSGFTVPTLVVAAENGPFFPARVVIPRATAVFRNPEVTHVLRGGNHFPSEAGFKELKKRAFDPARAGGAFLVSVDGIPGRHRVAGGAELGFVKFLRRGALRLPGVDKTPSTKALPSL